MKNCVICYAVPIPLINWSDVLLIETDRHNMPGGEVWENEMPEVAADRYLKAIGITPSLPDIRIMGVIQHKGELVYVCRCPFKVGDDRQGPAVIGGAVWMPLNEVVKKGSVVPHSIRLAAALCRAGIANWAFTNDGPIIGLNLTGWQ